MGKGSRLAHRFTKNDDYEEMHLPIELGGETIYDRTTIMDERLTRWNKSYWQQRGHETDHIVTLLKELREQAILLEEPARYAGDRIHKVIKAIPELKQPGGCSLEPAFHMRQHQSTRWLEFRKPFCIAKSFALVTLPEPPHPLHPTH